MDDSRDPSKGRPQEWLSDPKARDAIFKQKPSDPGVDLFREAKLFRTPDRATLTFFLGPEVASIHFDRQRNEIFYKGHNVKNMTLTQDQWLALQNFSNYLTREGVEDSFCQAYEACLGNMPPPAG